MRGFPPPQDASLLEGSGVLGSPSEGAGIAGRGCREGCTGRARAAKIHLSSSEPSLFLLSQGQPGTRGFPGFPVSLTLSLRGTGEQYY